MVTTAKRPKVGVLALQGDFREHKLALESLGAEVALIRRAEELSQISGLVLPGGESSVIDKLSRSFGLFEPLKEQIKEGLPVYGTCAGMILLAERLVAAIPGQRTFGGLSATVRRNAFGSQQESFEAEISVPVLGEKPVHAVFIRAPWVEEASPEVEILGSLPNGKAVAVRQKNVLATSFHPEVSGDLRFHELFLGML